MAKEWMENMTSLNSFKKLVVAAVAAVGLFACGGEETVKVATSSADASAESSVDSYVSTVAKPGSPYTVSYRIIGTPIVGSPVTVDLQVESNQGTQPLNLEYRINDASSMLLGESQPASVRMEFAANESSFTQQVTIIPQREGRFYLNVSASFETADGTMSTVTAIPIQVGTGTRELQPHGEVQQDEDGNAVRVLTNDPTS
jgi:hypothetical protein